ncbi:hypothetical protein KQI74_03690 [Paenibacillus barcinonensis]|uniref:colicin E5-related ribonuclease n=1 Tax=Paenibacillus barcinonensis TaxID=198119 RepID=UPI001C1264C9|nr:colicin E5-related ribonuclease [Paenibacillus barcinonensis]MBU5351368.1 hypothetical protein [Paenibacillus barcinonensis]
MKPKTKSAFLKKVFLMFNIIVLLFSLSIQPKANAIAFAPAIGLGGLEAGAIMLWGGAILVAATGTAVGLDPELMDEVKKFGEQAWNDADEITRQAIASSINGMDKIWSTSKKYSLKWSSEAQVYLNNKWNEYFAAGAYVNPTTGKIEKIATINSVNLPSSVRASYPSYDDFKDLGIWKRSYGDLYITGVYVDPLGNIQISSRPRETIWPNVITNKKYPNALVAYNTVVKELKVETTFQTVKPIFILSNNNNSSHMQFKPLSVPNTFPTQLTIPALKGIVNSQGEITSLEKPNIGRVGNSINGDVAISYPTYVGDVGTFGKPDAVTAAPAVVKLEVQINEKINKQMKKRGWTEDSIESTVNEPHETSEAENKANGKEATAYFNEDGSYVTVENESGLIIQVSNRNDPDWEPDSTIKNPYSPRKEKKLSLSKSNITDKATVRGGLYLYNFSDAIDLITYCKDNNLSILGIDAFIISKDKTQPVSEHSVDYSDSSQNGNWDNAITFLQSKSSLNHMYEVTYSEETDTSVEKPTYSVLDLIAYKAMVQFITKYSENNPTASFEQLLEFVKLSESGTPINSNSWKEWKKNLVR